MVGNGTHLRDARLSGGCAVGVAIGSSLVTYFVVSIAGFATYGSNAKADILTSYPKTVCPW